MDFIGKDEDEDIESGAEKKLLAKLEKYFQSEGLSKFSSRAAVAYFQKFAGKMPNVTRHVLESLNHSVHVNNPGQKGCPGIIPGLRAFPVWYHPESTSIAEASISPSGEADYMVQPPSAAEFPWIDEVESYFERVRDEFLQQQGHQAEEGGIKFQPYRGPPSEETLIADAAGGVGQQFSAGSDEYGKFATNDTGNWNVCYLSLHNEQISADISANNLNNMTATSTLLAEAIPRDYHHCLFSAVSTGTHILPHHGPTNKKLRIHMPIIVPSRIETAAIAVEEECNWRRLTAAELAVYDITRETRPCLRAHDQVIYFKEGQCFVFDDSFEHEVFNPPSVGTPGNPGAAIPPRVVLIIDIWHPDLTAEEVKFLKFMEKNQMRGLAKLSQLQQTQSDITPNVSNSNNAPLPAVVADTSNFYSVILNARHHATVNDKLVWG